MSEALTPQENTSMTNKAKIHVFLGAPHPASLGQESPEKGSSEWRTKEFRWCQGRLWPGKEDTNATNSECNEDNIQKKQGEISSNAHGEVDRNQTDDHVKPSILGSHEDNTPVPKDDFRPLVCQSSLTEQAHPREVDLCPGVVTEYLDSCLPFQQPDQKPDPNRHLLAGTAMSVETEYLTIWTKSQSLLLRGSVGAQSEAGSFGTPGSPHTPLNQTPTASVGSPELYSPPVSPEDRGLGGTLQGSAGLFIESLSQRHQEGDVILECTPDGLLCSQVGPPGRNDVAAVQESSGRLVGSPSTSGNVSPTPSTSKRAKLSPTTSKTQKVLGQNIMLPQCGPTTLLYRCKSHGVRYSILVAVVHPFHLKEVKVKSGTWAGSSIPLATVIVTDQSGVEMKVVLWRAAAFWALTVYPGDILLISDVTLNVDKWRGETVLQSSNASRLLNLGQVTQSNNPPAPHNVNIHTLRALCSHLHEKRPLLASLPLRATQDPQSIPFVRLVSLRPDTLGHAILKVKHTRMIADWRDGAEGTSRTGSMLKAVLTVEQGDGSQGAVVLWGSALSWLQHIKNCSDAVWEFRRLLVKQDMTSGLLELHSTPWGSCQRLSPNDTRYQEFWAMARSHRGSNSFEIDLHTLLSQKYTGDVELRVQITAFQFQSSPSQDAVQLVDGKTSLKGILDVVSGDITYTGCGLCCAELDTDENGIYRPCYPCLPHTGVRRYYRPVVLTVREGENCVCVQVPPTLVQKIMLNTPPDKLNKSVAPMSEERFVQVVAKRIHSILSTPRATFHLKVRSHFDSDENNITVIQNFSLLDFISHEA